MPKINFKGQQINYFTYGKGKPVVLLHGFCEDSSMWEDFISAFAHYQIIGIDLPGFGSSSPVENPTIEKFADSVNVLLEKLSIQNCFMIGHSMGGYVSLAFAKKYGKRLRGLGIFHSHPYPDTPAQKELRAKSIEFIKKNGHFHYLKQLFPKLFPPDFLSSNRFLVDKMMHRASSFPATGIIGGQQAMMNRPDQSAVLAAINCPVLFIIGREDEVVATEHSFEQTALPEVAHIHALNGVGHMGMFEAPKETQKIINQFLKYCVEFPFEDSKKTL